MDKIIAGAKRLWAWIKDRSIRAWNWAKGLFTSQPTEQNTTQTFDDDPINSGKSQDYPSPALQAGKDQGASALRGAVHKTTTGKVLDQSAER